MSQSETSPQDPTPDDSEVIQPDPESDREVRSAAGRPIGPIHRFAEVDSTNEVAFRALGIRQASHGAVFVAEHQTQGRGRRGTTWHSTNGQGLFLSAIWQPQNWVAAPLLTMATGLATWKALCRLGAEETRLKWPNDVIHARGKLAGILVESRGLDPSKPTFVVGIGINVAQEEFPAALLSLQSAVSLHQLGHSIPMERVEAALLEALAEEWSTAEKDPASTCKTYLEATELAGKLVEAVMADGPIAGTVLELDPTKGLALQVTEGAPQFLRLEQIRSLRAMPC